MKMPRKLQRYGLEFLTVFLGVSLSLLAENWRQRRADTNAEHNSLAQLNSDLRSEEDDMTQNMARAQTGLQAARFLVSDIRGHSADSVSDAFEDLGQCSFFVPYASEYTALKSSGRLTIIEDPALREQIVRFYEVDPFVQWLHERDCILTGELMDSLVGKLEFAEPGNSHRDSVRIARADSIRTARRDSTRLARGDSSRAARPDSPAQRSGNGNGTDTLAGRGTGTGFGGGRGFGGGPGGGGGGGGVSRYPRPVFRAGQESVVEDRALHDRLVRLATQRNYLIGQVQNRVRNTQSLRTAIKLRLGSDTLPTTQNNRGTGRGGRARRNP